MSLEIAADLYRAGNANQLEKEDVIMRSHPLILSLMLLVATSLLHLPAASAQSPIQERRKLEKENAELKTKVKALEEENAALRLKLGASSAPEETDTDSVKTETEAAPPVRSGKGGFGKTRWGMSLKEVKRHYPRLKKEGEYYAKEHTIDGVDGILAFDFHEGALVSVIFIGTERYTNKNEHLSDFDTLAGLLTQKYGTPNVNDVSWDNDLYRDDPSSYGMAISMGHLDIKKGWDQEGTRVGLMLSGQNFKVSLTLVYMDLAGMKKKNAVKKEAILEEL